VKLLASIISRCTSLGLCSGTKRQFARCKAMSGVESKADCRLHVQTSQFDPTATLTNFLFPTSLPD
jgi:hypothetical protein